MYITEKHKQTIYKEDCMWLMAASKMPEKNVHLLKRPYLRHQKPQQTEQTPKRTFDETLNYIFDDI